MAFITIVALTHISAVYGAYVDWCRISELFRVPAHS